MSNSCCYMTIGRGIAVRTPGVTYYFWLRSDGLWRYRTSKYASVSHMAHHAKNA